MSRVVLVTGVSRALGRRLARRLAADPDVDRVVGIDVTPPRGDLGSVRFVRADIRNPVVAKVIAAEDVDTVVHASLVCSPGEVGGRVSMKEHNVIGSMQLLAACQRAPGVRRLVVRSSAEIYGSSPKDPAMFTEDVSPRRQPRSGFGRDVGEIEGYVRGFARRRPDVAVTVLRAAPTLAPRGRGPLAEYLRQTVVPRPLGFDARLMLLHHDDLAGALHHATTTGCAGTFNVAGDGVVTLSQALRRLGRTSVAVPRAAMGSFGSAARFARLAGSGLTTDQLAYLTYGRGVDTSRMHDVLGFEPAHTTASVLEEFRRSLPPAPFPLRSSMGSALVNAGRGRETGEHRDG